MQDFECSFSKLGLQKIIQKRITITFSNVLYFARIRLRRLLDNTKKERHLKMDQLIIQLCTIFLFHFLWYIFIQSNEVFFITEVTSFLFSKVQKVLSSVQKVFGSDQVVRRLQIQFSNLELE